MDETEKRVYSEIMSTPGPEAHLCGECGKRLPCPSARSRRNPCDCVYPSLALISTDNPNEESEVFFCNDPLECRQKFLEKCFS